MAEKINLICDNCGKRFEKYKNKISTNNFCSRDCYLIFHAKDVQQYVCETCGATFKGDKYNANRFCSRKCYEEYHQIKNKTRVCPTCKQSFTAKSSEDIYCSWECYNKDRHMPNKEKHWNWQGGISITQDKKDSVEYKKWRQQVYERDNYKCTKCGNKNNLNAHHIKSWKHHPELRYDINNGITLCEECHIKLHQNLGYDLND